MLSLLTMEGKGGDATVGDVAFSGATNSGPQAVFPTLGKAVKYTIE